MSPLNKECQLPCDLILCISDSVVMSLSKLWEMVKDGEGSLACCSPWGCKELEPTEQLKNSK